MDGTIIGQGRFVANIVGLTNPATPGTASVGQANPTIIAIPSGADWVRVINYTRSGAVGNSGAFFNGTANANIGNEFYWQRGMAAGTGIAEYNSNTASTVNRDTLVSGGFTLYDPSGQTTGAQPLLGAPVAFSAISSAAQPVLTVTSTSGVSVGTVIRLSNSTQTDTMGSDFVVGAVVVNTSITLLTATNALANAPTAGGAGFYRIVNNGNTALFYPRVRRITNITQALNAQVSTSIAHGLTPGQEVRFNIPAVSGMIQLNPDPLNNYFPTGSLTSAIILTVVDDYNFTLNIDSSAYTAFTYPTVLQQPSSFPEVTPFGEDTATSLLVLGAQVPTIAGLQIFNTNTGLLADSTVNTGFLGMILGNGGNGNALTTPILGPSGAVSYAATTNVPTADIMYWVAGKSTYGGL